MFKIAVEKNIYNKILLGKLRCVVTVVFTSLSLQIVIVTVVNKKLLLKTPVATPL